MLCMSRTRIGRYREKLRYSSLSNFTSTKKTSTIAKCKNDGLISLHSNSSKHLCYRHCYRFLYNSTLARNASVLRNDYLKQVHPYIDRKTRLSSVLTVSNRELSTKHGNYVSAQREVPPQFLSPTSSRYAYIATYAAEHHNIDPFQLFSKLKQTTLPPNFKSAGFQYIPPKAFNYELPENTNRPEVAFLGRSNVGKSSLLNSVMSQSLAAVSKSPGRTQSINYYALIPRNHQAVPKATRKKSASKKATTENNLKKKLNTASGFLIDLPGYGYAKAPAEKIAQWQQNTQEFLLHRRDLGVLKRVFMLIDSRLAGKKSGASTNLIDFAVLGWLEEAEIPYSIVLTKCDATKDAMIIKMVNEFCMRYQSQCLATNNAMDNEDMESVDGYYNDVFQSPLIHVTSAKKGNGMNEMLWVMDGDFSD